MISKVLEVLSELGCFFCFFDTMNIFLNKEERIMEKRPPWWSSWLWHPAVMEYCYRVVGGSTPVSIKTNNQKISSLDNA